MKTRTPLITGLATAAALATTLGVLGAAPVSADPDPGTTPTPIDLVGVGSDTTEKVMNSVAAAYNAELWGSATKLHSFDATGSATITPKAGCAEMPRPNGSSAGIKALMADQSTPACIDFARSSREKSTSGSEDGLAFLALGRDGVTWVRQEVSNAPASLTTAQLGAIYRCEATTWDQVGGTGTGTIEPYLPQSGSGTRSFWLSAIGVSTPGACVTQGVPENDGTALPNDPDVVAPYSIANYIAQAYRGIDDRHGTTVMGQIDSRQPTTGTGTAAELNPGFAPGFLRLVYNVVERTPLGEVAPQHQAVFGADGYICANQELVSAHGFGELGTECGAVS